MARWRLSSTARVLPATCVLATRPAAAESSVADTGEASPPICTLAMPAPVETSLPLSDSALPALLPSATASCVLPAVDSVLLATTLPSGPPARESASRPIVESAFTALTEPL